MKKNVLFICNRNFIYGSYQSSEPSEKIFSGLFNSARMISDMLDQSGFYSQVIRVIDYNSIDRHVNIIKPDVVIIEALWVTPNKLKELQGLHKHIKWVVRIHSELPFLSIEGIAIDWIKQYTQIPNVVVSCNSFRAGNDLNIILTPRIDISLPNYYPMSENPIQKKWGNATKVADVGCFGAIRPMKNQLIQAIAAIKWGIYNGYHIRFHINSSRVEQGGEPVLKNLRNLFKDLSGATLVQHGWMGVEDFKILLSTMDIGMQVSLSETFNIVSADMVDAGIPIVVSKEVVWAYNRSFADPTNCDDIIRTIDRVFNSRRRNIKLNRAGLASYSKKAKKTWIRFLELA